MYKKNYKEVIARLNDFYSGGGKNKICAKMCLPNPAIEKMKNVLNVGPVPCPDLDERAAFWDETLCVYADLQDDAIPSAYIAEADQGLTGGMLGGEVRFMLDTNNGWISSAVAKFAETAKDIYSYEIDLTNRWYRYYAKELSIFRERSEGKFGISHWCVLDGIHLLTEMIGYSKTFYEILDDPDTCRDVIDFAFKIALALQNKFFEEIGLFEGGTCSNMAQWLPGRCVSDSVDIYHLARADMFEEWGRKPVQRMFDAFDGAVLHIHSNGHHLIEHISTLRNLRAILLLDDKWNPPAYTEMDKLDPLRKGIPYIIDIPFEVFADRLVKHELHGNVFYNVTGVPDLETANTLMKDVRDYLA